MSIEFRPRKIGEYFDIVRRRKWLIILPTLAVGFAISYVIYRLPDIYESTTLIVVKQSTLPNSVVPTIEDEALTRELASISQVVTSRSSRSEEHTSELQSQSNLVCRLLLEKKKR